LVGIVGRLVAIKDLPTFLRAAVLVRETRPEVRFSVVGDGEEREATERLARGLGLGSAVFFHGWRRDMAPVYGDLDLVVNCSLIEGTPVALIEALTAARPVVATAVGGTPDLLAGGSRGLLVPPGDPRRLAGAMLQSLGDLDASRARRLASREQVLAAHSVERLVNDIDRLYREQLALRLGEARA
jgi:glycosyltransferase involved in cell wall biosynthesis